MASKDWWVGDEIISEIKKCSVFKMEKPKKLIHTIVFTKDIKWLMWDLLICGEDMNIFKVIIH